MDPETKPKKIVVETFASDMADVLSDDKGGTIRKIIEGEEEKEAEKKRLSPESRQNKTFMVTSLVLVILGLGVVTYFLGNDRVGTVAIERQFEPLVFTDKSTFLEVGGYKRSEVINSVRNEALAGSELKVRGVKGIYLAEKSRMLGLRQLAKRLSWSLALPDPVLLSDNFMLGAVKIRPEDAGSGVFFLLRPRSTVDIFDQMRDWEGKMFYDLYEIFGVRLGSENDYLLTKAWEDGLVENKNARLLYDQAGNPVLFYVYADNNSVVISDSLAAAREVMLRLASKQTKE